MGSIWCSMKYKINNEHGNIIIHILFPLGHISNSVTMINNSYNSYNQQRIVLSCFRPWQVILHSLEELEDAKEWIRAENKTEL